MRLKYGRRATVALVCATAALTLAACASSSNVAKSVSSGAGGDTSSGPSSGSLDGKGKEIVVFLPTSANVYIAGEIRGMQAQSAELNYKLRIYQNNFDSSQQDQQVQQFLASNDKPALVVWWPSNAETGVNDVRLLSRIAPIIQINQRIIDAEKKYVKAYVGVNDFALSSAAAQAAIGIRKTAVANGFKLHSTGGNLIELRFSKGYLAGDDRTAGFADGSKSAPFNILRVDYATGAFDAQDGFNHASPLIPQFKSQGVDFVYGQTLDQANGALKALQQNGLTPNKDVIVLGGNCSGNLENLASGLIAEAVVQPPLMEGQLAIRTAAQYLAVGKIDPGTVTVPPTPTVPALTMTAPKAATYLPVSVLTKANVNTLNIWGYTGAKLCSG